MKTHPSEARRAPKPHSLLLSLGAGAACLAWSHSASADSLFGLAISYSDALDELSAVDGAGVDIYGGPRLDLAPLSLTAELQAGYHKFSGPLEPDAYRLMAGGRVGVGVGALLRPIAFAHLGVGHLRYNLLPAFDRESNTGLAAEAGLGLDVTLLPLIDLGLHGSYSVITGDENEDEIEWLQIGVHASWAFAS